MANSVKGWGGQIEGGALSALPAIGPQEMEDSTVQALAAVSLAISAKRIADSLESIANDVSVVSTIAWKSP